MDNVQKLILWIRLTSVTHVTSKAVSVNVEEFDVVP
jgi:hypothetical protein